MWLSHLLPHVAVVLTDNKRWAYPSYSTLAHSAARAKLFVKILYLQVAHQRASAATVAACIGSPIK
jgi:hypothetical protein